MYMYCFLVSYDYYVNVCLIFSENEINEIKLVGMTAFLKDMAAILCI